ncbi:hypothetical protein Q0Z83_052520 [Actinoplanes sichuanensis]|nr:hypothetical protein Q0Z83_052520 [Actinoplanes sichuanensis]
MAWFIGQSLVFILLAFVLGVITGRLSRWSAKKAPEPAVTIDDELERIEGVGPAMANALRAAGIRTFEQLAESGDDTKRDAIRVAGLSFAPSLTTWSRQARLLADGDEVAFAELTARLIAGRDTTRAGTTQAAGKPRPRPRPQPAGTEEKADAHEKADPHDEADASEKADAHDKAGTHEKADAHDKAGADEKAAIR